MLGHGRVLSPTPHMRLPTPGNAVPVTSATLNARHGGRLHFSRQDGPELSSVKIPSYMHGDEAVGGSGSVGKTFRSPVRSCKASFGASQRRPGLHASNVWTAKDVANTGFLWPTPGTGPARRTRTSNSNPMWSMGIVCLRA